MKLLKNKFNTILKHKKVKRFIRNVKKKKVVLLRWANKNPIKSVLIICAILLVLIAFGEWLRIRASRVQPIPPEPKQVSTYQIGQSARVNVLGTVKKDNIVHIRAQSGGIIQNIYAEEGLSVYRGATLAYISSNYQGGSAQILQRQIAQANYNHVKDTYDQQKEVIQKQKDAAEKTDTNNDKLREISRNSIDRIRNQLNFNRDVLISIEATLLDLESASPSSETQALIASSQLFKSQMLAANDQLQTSIDTLEYTTDDDKVPSELSNIAKDLAVKQLEIAEKSLDLQKEVTYLQLRLAQINESLVFPASFLKGVVEKVHVRAGESVSPGQTLFTLSGPAKTVRVDALVSQSLAKGYSRLEPSRIRINNKLVEVEPSYISNEATNGTLYNISFTLQEEYSKNLTDGTAISVSLPIGYPDTSAAVPIVPIDVVSQNSDGSYIYIVKDNQAKVVKVELGELFGQFVVVTKGLNSGDQIIVEKFVLEDDIVEVIPHEK
jgi:multidrug efflux pump subunit AcrA (membrane-fusion protein)